MRQQQWEEENAAVAALRRCVGYADLRRLHSAIEGNPRLRASEYVCCFLMRIYGRAGRVAEVERVFGSIPGQPGVHAWSIFLHAYRVNGLAPQSKAVFDAMPRRNAIAWTDMISAAASAACAWHVLRRMPAWSSVAWNAMVSASGPAAYSVFAAAPFRNDMTWHSLLAANARSGHFESSLGIFRKMPLHSTAGANLVLLLCSKARTDASAECADAVFGAMLERDWESWASLIAAQQRVRDAISVADRMPARPLVVLNMILNLQAKLGEGSGAAKALFQQMPQRDVISWTTLQRAATGRCEAAQVFDRMPMRDAAAWSAMVASLSSSGRIDEAVLLLQQMPKDANAVNAETALILGAARKGRLKEADSVFRNMKARNSVTWTTLVVGYAECGQMRKAAFVLDKMPARGMVAWNAIIAAASREGNLAAARFTFDNAPERDAISWATLLTAFAQNGDLEEAFRLHSSMMLEGMQASAASLAALLLACNHCGMLSHGARLFRAMAVEHCVEQGIEHYNLLVELLGRAGQLRVAEQVVSSMPLPPDSISWTSLLSLCNVHRDAARAVTAAEQIVRLESVNSSPYVTLSELPKERG